MEKILEKVANDNVKFIQLQFTDLYGIVKSLTIPTHKLQDALEFGVWFDGSSILGFSRISESDMYLKADLDTYAVIPWLNSEYGNTARFICDIFTPNGQPFEGDPRYILKKVLKKAKDMGFRYNTGPELEFFLLETKDRIAPLPHDKGSYFDLTTDEAYNIRREMTTTLEKFGIEIETTHHEVAVGQHEISFKYDNALKTADNAMTMRFVVKAIAQKNGLHATFMPKPLAGENGSGMHVHQSLFDITGEKNMFFDASNEYNLSETAYHFIAGQLSNIKAMSAILSPTVNSYKRLVPGYEAPVYLSWGRTNRSALIRIPSSFKGKEKATRVELRSPDPSSNIYLTFAVMLAAGLKGIEKNLKPPVAQENDIYLLTDDEIIQKKIETLPQSLWEALQNLKKNELMKKTLGEHTFDKYIEAKEKEWRSYSIQVTNWEIKEYMERY